MNLIVSARFPSSLLLLIAVLLVSGCSSSGDSSSNEPDVTTDANDATNGISDLDDPLSETPQVNNQVLDSVQASLSVESDKTFRISWQAEPAASVYRVFENTDGQSGFIQISEDLSDQVHEFNHRVALYDRSNAWYFVQACNAVGVCVDSDALIVDGTLNRGVGYFKGSNTGESDRFGTSISFSSDGNTIAVGAAGDNSSAIGVNGLNQGNPITRSGAVYIFQRTDGQWLQTDFLKASNPGEFDVFGDRVQLNSDGTILAVGAASEDSASQEINGDQTDNSAMDAGAVYIFERTGTAWTQTHYVKASLGRAIAYFGASLSLSNDGNTFITSGSYSTNGPHDVVYIYDRVGDSWQESIIESSFNERIFGADALALSGDGNTLVVGDSRTSTAETQIASALVYIRTADGWQYEALLRGENTEQSDQFAVQNSLAISANGNTIAVGAPYEAGASIGINNANEFNENASYRAGAVYVFQRSGEQWEQQAYIKASNTDAEDDFGRSISLNAAGDILAVGALEEHSSASGINGDDSDNSIPVTSTSGGDGSGAAYVFVLNSGVWRQQAYVKSSNTEAGDSFGQQVVLSGDGSTLAVAAPNEDSASNSIDVNVSDNSATNSGALYLY